MLQLEDAVCTLTINDAPRNRMRPACMDPSAGA